MPRPGDLPPPTADRRPIASRAAPPFVWLAGRLVRWRVSPDAISLAGLACGLLAGLAFAATRDGGAAQACWALGAVLVQCRLLANMLDGMVALGGGTASRLGELFNEVPDRLSDTAILLGVGVAAGRWDLGLAAALAAMSTAYVRALGRAAGTASIFVGPMAKPQRMALVTLLALWCAVAPARWGSESALPEVALWVVAALSALTAARRLVLVARALRTA